MATITTQGIRISVETFYQHKQSNPLLGHYMFAYRINIHNDSDHAVQLLRRHWYITDANGLKREVEGEGVVGQQPVIQPGDSYEYVSGCDFATEIGKMHGTYLMKRTQGKQKFEAKIPEFTMVYPFKMN